MPPFLYLQTVCNYQRYNIANDLQFQDKYQQLYRHTAKKKLLNTHETINF